MYCKQIFISNVIILEYKKRYNKKKILNFNNYLSDNLLTTTFISDILEVQSIVDKTILNNKIYLSINGRIIFKRCIGKIVFLMISEMGLLFQICISNKNILDLKLLEKNLDIGDIIYIEGYLFFTKVKILTLMCLCLKVLLKSLKALPSKGKFFLKKTFLNKERYINILLDTESFQLLVKRSNFIKYIRYYLQNNKFIEVETPILQNIISGASADPFITFYNHFNKKVYLRVSPELYLKKLLVGGFSRIFEIGKNFRNEGLSSIHQPEFTMIEIYCTYINFQYLISFIEYLLKSSYFYLNKNNILNYKNYIIDMNKPFFIISMKNSINYYLNSNYSLNNRYDILKIIFLYAIPYNYRFKYGYMLNIIFEILIQPKLIFPTFITEYPVEVSPLASRCNKDTRFTQRFELFIFGIEISNGFFELNEPDDQLSRFLFQTLELCKSKCDIDFDFINSIYYGLPPTGGVGLGIDRFLMLSTNTFNIKNTSTFSID